MAKHDIWMSFPDKPLRNVDTTIAIWSDRKMLGELRVSRGSIDWRRRKKQKAKRISWENLAYLLDNYKEALRALAKAQG